MNVSFVCPGCQNPVRESIGPETAVVECHECSWQKAIAADEFRDGAPEHCLICGCHDLWRQKDFPQRLGLTMVALGAGLSTLAWAWYMPLTALGVLLAFALVDVLLYTFMKDVLVCYRCAARYRDAGSGSEHAGFNLETAERYRQEAARLASVRSPAAPAP